MREFVPPNSGRRLALAALFAAAPALTWNAAQADASKLGTELTPIGAIRAGRGGGGWAVRQGGRAVACGGGRGGGGGRPTLCKIHARVASDPGDDRTGLRLALEPLELALSE